MAWCGVQDAGAVVMGATLKANRGLVDVDLSGNGITSEGAAALAAGVAASESLAAILIDNNDIRCVCACATCLCVCLCSRVGQSPSTLPCTRTHTRTHTRASYAHPASPRLHAHARVRAPRAPREEGGKAMLKAVQDNKGLVACHMENTNTSPQLRSAVQALLAPRQQRE